MSGFIPGLQLSRIFYDEAVQPILATDFPGLRYAATLIGWGSEVLGYDTPLSTDHHWGPRLLLFLPEEGFDAERAAVDSALRAKLPTQVRGFATNFGPPDAIGVRLPPPVAQGPVDHMVEIFTVRSLLGWYLGWDPSQEITVADWLTFSEHKLLTLVSGAVFHDGLGDLTAVRRRLAYYPTDVWLYLLAAQWERIAEEEAFVGRCGDVGDDLGSRLVAARLARDLMRLAFLMERTYAPYAKWFGTAFARLRCAPRLAPSLAATLAANTWQEREGHLAAAYTVAAELHNALGITAPLATNVSSYHGRPYRTIDADRVAEAIRARIADDAVRALPFAVGSVNQLLDSTDKTANIALGRRLRVLYASER